MVNPARGIRIAELARRSGTPKETIHYYVRVGLLRRPKKTSRNMAYYDESHVEQLKQIKRLQNESYLPLEIIKKVLREGRLAESARKADLAGDFLGRHGTRADFEPLDASALEDQSGLSSEDVARFEAAGLLRPTDDDGKKRYGWEDSRIAEILKTAAEEAGPDGSTYVAERFQILERHVSDMVQDEIAHFFMRVLSSGDPARAIELLRGGRETIGRYLALARARRLRDEIDGIFRQVEGALRAEAPLLRPLPPKHRKRAKEPEQRAALERALEEAPAAKRGAAARALIEHLVLVADSDDALDCFAALDEETAADPEIAALAAEAMVETRRYDEALALLSVLRVDDRKGTDPLIEAVYGAAILGQLQQSFRRTAASTRDKNGGGWVPSADIISSLTLGLTALASARALHGCPGLVRARADLLIGRVQTLTPHFLGSRRQASGALRDALATSRSMRGGPDDPGFGVLERIELNAALYLVPLVKDAGERAALEETIKSFE